MFLLYLQVICRGGINKHNFLEAAGNLEGEDDHEILEKLPVKVNAPMAP